MPKIIVRPTRAWRPCAGLKDTSSVHQLQSILLRWRSLIDSLLAGKQLNKHNSPQFHSCLSATESDMRLKIDSVDSDKKNLQSFRFSHLDPFIP